MHARLDETQRLLEQLVSFPIISGDSNLDIIGYVRDYLAEHGISAELSYDETGLRANLYATVGPMVDGGVVLCGHTDVVPVEGQDWTFPPFRLTRSADRFYGRGSVDMKGFLACALAQVPAFADAELARPIHIAFSFDEETGSIGAPVLARQILAQPFRPIAVIVGEPTEMQVIGGHKGGYEMRTEFTGFAGHSSDPSRGVNAIHYASRFVNFLVRLSEEMAENPPQNSPFQPPNSTLNVGTIQGGTGRSILAESCALDWELRVTPPETGVDLMARVEAYLAEELMPRMRSEHPDAAVRTDTISVYPGLDYDPNSSALDIVRLISGQNSVSAVPFGTDAGCFHSAGLPSVVFGPGSIEQAHKPDEFIEIGQIEACLRFLDGLTDFQCQTFAERRAQ